MTTTTMAHDPHALAHSPDSETAATTATTPTAATKKTPRAKLLLGALTLAAIGAGVALQVAERGKESTDDAQVEAHVASVATRVAGQVRRVRAHDNQIVTPGDVLVELDDRDYVARLQAARADLAAAKAGLAAAEAQLAVTDRTVVANLRQARGGVASATASVGATHAGIAQAKADLAAAVSRRTLAKLELERTEALVKQSAVSQAELDTRRAQLDQASAVVEQAEARLVSAETGVQGSSGTVESARGRLVAAETGPAQLEAARAQVGVAKARVEQAQAAADQAELNVSYTKIRAAVGGVISRRNVEPGQMVSPERPLLAVVPLDDVWIVANFKESQIAAMAPGQPVKIKVDAFGSRPFTGHVESLAAATGVPGGLRADDVATRAEATSFDVFAKRAELEAAARGVDQALIGYFPQLALTARYLRLSPIDSPLIGNAVVAPNAPVGPLAPGTPHANVPLSFTAPEQQTRVSATVAIPISDYLLRITQAHAAATRGEAAARYAERAARLKARADAKIAY